MGVKGLLIQPDVQPEDVHNYVRKEIPVHEVEVGDLIVFDDVTGYAFAVQSVDKLTETIWPETMYRFNCGKGGACPALFRESGTAKILEPR
ncbi:hypothetical protein Ntsu_65440 [Nocardia sp. IFM 10818]